MLDTDTAKSDGRSSVPLSIKASGKTDKGLVRAGNEDYLHIDEDNLVFAVCDGMGGHQAGEVASMTAAETILKSFSHFRHDLLEDGSLGVPKDLPPSGDVLVKSIRLANRAIYNMALEDSGLSGMGTTVVAVAFESDIMSIAHVGDSRAYRLREKDLEPLTRDHSWVAEIQESQNLTAEEASSVVGKNVITRALGVRDTVEVDYRIEKVEPGEIILLCSDGLCGFADDYEIYDVAAKHRSDLSKMVDDLIQMANDRGGSDNVTVIALQVEAIESSPLPPVEAYTVDEENETESAAEDGWLDQYSRLSSHTAAAANDPPSKGPSATLLVAIFAVFAIVAVLIIWLQS
ncbi:Stp1/IreP family PP2C-type Ser/Thr phosphatase [candidate division GN15 bacterium]|nr:Stp1/IreP family PP2C-type Ser/Thr phosphatase [candidate division GN15 bacterium]